MIKAGKRETRISSKLRKSLLITADLLTKTKQVIRYEDSRNRYLNEERKKRERRQRNKVVKAASAQWAQSYFSIYKPTWLDILKRMETWLLAQM